MIIPVSKRTTSKYNLTSNAYSRNRYLIQRYAALQFERKDAKESKVKQKENNNNNDNDFY